MAPVNLFIADGRLGNQLFQLNCIRALGLRNVWLSGYEESISVIGPDKLVRLRVVSRWAARLISSRKFKELLIKRRVQLERIGIRVLSGRGLSTREQLEEIVGDLNDHGLNRMTRIIIYLEFTMLGSNSYQRVQETHKEDYIRDDLRVAADMWFQKRGLKAEECCFLHVRRGDYKCWPSKEMNAILPTSFYRCAVRYIRDRSRVRGLKVLVASDDQVYLRDYDGDYLIEESARVTFAILSMCRHGILSPSTFSLAATFHDQERKAEGLFIAPMFWGGYNGDQWYPEKDSIYFDEILYLSKEGKVTSGLWS